MKEDRTGGIFRAEDHGHGMNYHTKLILPFPIYFLGDSGGTHGPCFRSMCSESAKSTCERGWEIRDRHRRLILVTLEMRQTEQKGQLLNCFYLNLFFLEEMDKEKNEHIHFLYLWRPTQRWKVLSKESEVRSLHLPNSIP